MSKKHEELISGLEAAVEARDAESAVPLLERLGELFLNSNTGYYHRYEDLKPELLLLLFEQLEPAKFGELLANSSDLYESDFWETLERVAEWYPPQSYWVLREWLGLPSHTSCPQVHKKLAEAEVPEITAGLIETIGELSAAESTRGIDFFRDEKLINGNFATIRWVPEYAGLSEFVYLLACRKDDQAQDAVARYLRTLPWGIDRQATHALLNGMAAKGSQRNRELLVDALEYHTKPTQLRIWLWNAIGAYDRQECILGVLRELESAVEPNDRIAWIDALYPMLFARHETPSGEMTPQEQVDDRVIAAAAEQMDTTAWRAQARGYFGTVLSLTLPETDVSQVSSLSDRWLISLVRIWDIVRLDHLGCGIQLLLIAAFAWGLTIGLDWLLGPPIRLTWMPRLLFALWLLWGILTIRTDFTGIETLGSKMFFALGYLGLFLAALFSLVFVRIG
ncbi:MAG: hypothetical protein WDZ51_16995 [Pirellulaceae bacterium]